mgnify:CR=1 FL=1
MQRRPLLLLGGLALAGCNALPLVEDPRIQGSPRPTYTPTPPARLAGVDHATGLEMAAAGVLAASASAPWAAADGSRWPLLAGIRRSHAAVLGSVDPLRRQAGPVPSVPPVAAAATRDAGVAAMTAALVSLRDAELVLARESSGVASALWASLAAAAEQARAALSLAVTAATPAVPMRLVDVVTPWDVAANRVLSRYHEAVYGSQSALGFLPPRHPWRTPVSLLVTGLKAERDSLVAHLRSRSVTPDPGAPAYSLPTATTDAEIQALLGGLVRAITQACGVWVASADPEGRQRAAAGLVSASTLGLPLGLGLAEWPGWPD